MTVEKKILPEYFDAVVSGDKKYELRLQDFDISVGDELLLREWNMRNKEYTGRKVIKKVTYVGKFKTDELFWSKEDVEEKGLQILSLE